MRHYTFALIALILLGLIAQFSAAAPPAGNVTKFDLPNRGGGGNTTSNHPLEAIAPDWQKFTAKSDDAKVNAALAKARASAEIAGTSLGKVNNWLHRVALKRIDPKTSLYYPEGNWTYQDAWADCYPFFLWAAWATDLDTLNGPVRKALHAEIKNCDKDFFERPENFFGGSEYVKDALIAIVEVTGKDEWFDRMQNIEDQIWKNPPVKTPYGNIPSTNVEINGEQLQALARMFTMTGEKKYLEYGNRLASYYLLGQKNYAPSRLRDHGCEIIGGLGLFYAVLKDHDPEAAKKYVAPMKVMLDRVIKEGANEDGIMHDTLGKRGGLSDGWGYNYVGHLCYDQAEGKPIYRKQVENTLRNLQKPAYKNRRWEGSSIDGFADSIEGAIYLLNRVPVEEAFAWVDRESAANLYYASQPGRLWGTMKLQANGVRTTILQALMHTRGVRALPWQDGLFLGATPEGTGILLTVKSVPAWKGKLYFDLPRHRLYQGLKRDYPRMNTVPEWFTVDPAKKYVVQNVATGKEEICTGKELSEGYAVSLAKGEELVLTVAEKK